jgi:DNA-binding LacI/PurR family transcriptional regulator
VFSNSASVSEAVRQRVLAAASALGYRAPHPQLPSSGHFLTIALVIPDILNPYFTEIARGVQDETDAADIMLLVLDAAEDPARELEFLRILASQPVGGVVLCGSRLSHDELSAALAVLGKPAVVLNRCLGLPNVACIVADLEAATYRAARHLLALHHRRIAFLPGPSTSETSQVRRRGIEMALAEEGLSLRTDWAQPSFPDIDGGFRAMSSLLALPAHHRPTAVITHNDLMALGVLHAARANHLRVPEDLSVVGIDDIPMAAHSNPPLTTLAPPKHRMGRMSAQLILRMVAGQSLPEDSYTLLEAPLIMRESTGPAPEDRATPVYHDEAMSSTAA